MADGRLLLMLLLVLFMLIIIVVMVLIILLLLLLHALCIIVVIGLLVVMMLLLLLLLSLHPILLPLIRLLHYITINIAIILNKYIIKLLFQYTLINVLLTLVDNHCATTLLPCPTIY